MRYLFLLTLALAACNGEGEGERTVWKCQFASGETLTCATEEDIEAYAGIPCADTGRACECPDGYECGCPDTENPELSCTSGAD